MIRAMEAELDPEWKPEMHVGGFSAHCSNQREQRYTYKSTDQVPRPIRLHKDGQWRDTGGNRYGMSDQPYKFYDYNF